MQALVTVCDVAAFVTACDALAVNIKRLCLCHSYIVCSLFPWQAARQPCANVSLTSKIRCVYSSGFTPNPIQNWVPACSASLKPEDYVSEKHLFCIPMWLFCPHASHRHVRPYHMSLSALQPAEEARQALKHAKNVSVVEIPLNDGWARDWGPSVRHMTRCFTSEFGLAIGRGPRWS